MSDAGLEVILKFALVCAVIGGVASLLLKDRRPYLIAAGIAIVFATVVSVASG